MSDNGIPASSRIAIVITGTPGAGKSSVGAALAGMLATGAHIPVDFFRKMVKGGYASPHHWSEEVARQYRIARRSAAQTALNLAAGGFTPILDDIVSADWVPEWIADLAGLDCRFVLLRPSLEAALERNRTRTIWTVDETVLRDLHAMLGGDYTRSWLMIDNTEGTAEEAAAEIRRRLTLS